jgi:hypothetical protein
MNEMVSPNKQEALAFKVYKVVMALFTDAELRGDRVCVWKRLEEM